MATPVPVTQDVTQLLERIQEVKYATLTTMSAQQRLHGRPMFTFKPEADGTLWFFSQRDAEKISEIQATPQVGLAYADPDKSTYVTLAGTAAVVEDRAKIKELWREDLRGFFPGGADDPSIALLKVQIENGEFWDTASNILTRAYAYAKVLATGERYRPSADEQAKVNPA